MLGFHFSVLQCGSSDDGTAVPRFHEAGIIKFFCSQLYNVPELQLDSVVLFYFRTLNLKYQKVRLFGFSVVEPPPDQVAHKNKTASSKGTHMLPANFSTPALNISP